MVKPFSTLPGFLETTARRVPLAADALTRDTARVALREVVQGTPVDSGEGRSNYITSLNGPALGVRPPFAPGVNLGINERANAQGAISAGEPLIRSYNGRTHPQGIFITNSVFHVFLLNEGVVRSTQNGPQFVERAAMMARVFIRTRTLLQDRGRSGPVF